MRASITVAFICCVCLGGLLLQSQSEVRTLENKVLRLAQDVQVLAEYQQKQGNPDIHTITWDTSANGDPVTIYCNATLQISDDGKTWTDLTPNVNCKSMSYFRIVRHQ